jgi:hypothetical protein
MRPCHVIQLILLYYSFKSFKLVMPPFGSEPKFEPELFGTGPKFGLKFRRESEPDARSSSAFARVKEFANAFKCVRTFKRF